MRRWRGLKKLIHNAVDHTTDLVEETQESVARKTLRYLDLFPPVGAPAHVVDQIRRLTSTGVFTTIHGVNQIVDFLTDLGLDTVEKGRDEPNEEQPFTPMRSDGSGSRGWAGDVAMGVVNGVIGDYLRERDNSLDLGMSFRFQDQYLQLDPSILKQALPEATSKIVIFVHGLCCTEWSWCMKAEEYYGDPAANFGTMLQQDLGYTPLYVRYNTGLHISINGRQLAENIDRLVNAYPHEVEEIVLIGHSMGGLVSRSACHYASQEEQKWLKNLTHIFCLSSPHLGAPLEKIGNVATSVLRTFDTSGTQIPARLINIRSAGIKDLRFGYLTDEEWSGKDPDIMLENNRQEIPLIDGVSYTFISATFTKSLKNPVGYMLGDLLVRRPSATGPATHHDSFRIETSNFGGMKHLETQNHPDVYQQILSSLRGSASRIDLESKGRPL
jgi:pimeloyl-ACP methyl ester carboxylesterase